MTHALTEYDRAFIKLKKAKDWPTKLGCAQTLSQSPRHADTAVARHVFDAYSLHLAGLLKPAEPANETSRDVLMGMRDRWGEIIVWGAAVAVAVWIGLGGLGL